MNRKIKVGFDISQVAHNGGVGVYTQNLAEDLSKIPLLDMTFFYSSLRKPYQGNLKNVKKFKLPPTLFEVLFNKIRTVGIEKFLGPIDIYHSSDWVQPPSKSKKVTTYHDVIPLKYPKWSHPKIVSVHKKRLELVEKEIDMVIAVSETTKKDLMELSNIPSEKITVIYEGVGKEFKKYSETEINKFREKYNLPLDFVLAFGGIGERKNLDRIKTACTDLNLIITGESIPYLPKEELPLLYNAASLLIYTTLYEGFGLPIVEAMACGTPVLTSNISSMPEIAGNAALLVDPFDTKAIKTRINELLSNSKLRQNLMEKGLKRSEDFSWEKTAMETAKVYERLME